MKQPTTALWLLAKEKYEQQAQKRYSSAKLNKNKTILFLSVFPKKKNNNNIIKKHNKMKEKLFVYFSAKNLAFYEALVTEKTFTNRNIKEITVHVF